jgi:hypothetical protein
MHATFHRGERGPKVSMIRRTHNDSIDVFAHLVQHHSEILIERQPVGLRIFLTTWTPPFIDVTQGHDVFILTAIKSHSCDTTGTNHGDIHFAIRGWAWLTNTKSRQYKGTDSSGGCGFDKLSTFHDLLLVSVL